MDREFYTESPDQFLRVRGENAEAQERFLVVRRHEEACRKGLSSIEADIEYLLNKRKEILYRWFALLYWLRQGLLKSGDAKRTELLGGMWMRGTGAHVQTHRADVEDCQAAHLMHCNLQFLYGAAQCEAYEFLKGGRASSRDYRFFARNIFAATANVFSIVNEIDSYLEKTGAANDLATLSTTALKVGLDPGQATASYLNDYQTLIKSCQARYPEVIREYQAGSSSLEARIAKDQSLSNYLKKDRKLSLFDVYHNQVQKAQGYDVGMRNMVNAAYRARHEEWGTAPNRLLP
jgi:hypothetical protein